MSPEPIFFNAKKEFRDETKVLSLIDFKIMKPTYDEVMQFYNNETEDGYLKIM